MTEPVETILARASSTEMSTQASFRPATPLVRPLNGLGALGT